MASFLRLRGALSIRINCRLSDRRPTCLERIPSRRPPAKAGRFKLNLGLGILFQRRADRMIRIKPEDLQNISISDSPNNFGSG